VRGEYLIWFFRKIPQMEDEIQLSKYLDLQVKCPSLMTDRDETYTFCREWIQGAKYRV
jgi:hypothetical protein